MPEKTLEFSMEKETKNTIMYREKKDDNGKVVIGPLYVQKSFLITEKDQKPPEKVSVYITY